MNIVTDIRAYQ